MFKAVENDRSPDLEVGRASFDTLYQAHWAGLVRLGYALCGSLPLAEDIVHDAFLRLVPSLERVRAPPAYLRKAGLSLNEPVGKRWELALDLIERGESFVVIGGVQIARHVGWPGADGLIHIAVLAGSDQTPPRQVAQGQVDACRAFISQLASEDPRLQLLLERFGAAWEYVGDDGSASWLIAGVADDGSLIWSTP